MGDKFFKIPNLLSKAKSLYIKYVNFTLCLFIAMVFTEVLTDLNLFIYVVFVNKKDSVTGPCGRLFIF